MIRLQEFTRRQIIILSVLVVTIISIVGGSLYLSHKYHSYPQELVAVDSLCESNIDSAAILLNNHIMTITFTLLTANLLAQTSTPCLRVYM